MATELIKLLARSRRPSIGLRLLFDVGAMHWLLPQLVPAIGFDQKSPHHHLPVDEHTLLTVDEAAARTDDIVVRVAALLHDVAKPSRFSEHPNREGRMVGHFHGGPGSPMAHGGGDPICSGPARLWGGVRVGLTGPVPVGLAATGFALGRGIRFVVLVLRRTAARGPGERGRKTVRFGERDEQKRDPAPGRAGPIAPRG